jgi:protein gp37
MQKTGIEYLDLTWNPIAMRCTPVSLGCDNCWHLTTADRLCKNLALLESERLALAGQGPFVLRSRELSAPEQKRKPSVIGVQFMGDFFHAAIPDSWRDLIMSIMVRANWHTYIILTKRHEEQRRYMVNLFGKEGPPSHIWNMITICSQREADEKLSSFLQIHGNKGLSIEPMLGPIRIAHYLRDICGLCDREGKRPDKCDEDFTCMSAMSPKRIGVVIVGGETGKNTLPLSPNHVRIIRSQCEVAGVPFCFKQWGEWSPVPVHADHFKIDVSSSNEGSQVFMHHVGRNKAGCLLDGRIHNELPWRVS